MSASMPPPGTPQSAAAVSQTGHQFGAGGVRRIGRVARAVLSALAVYLAWRALAPPYDRVGTPASARLLMAFVSALLVAGLIATPYVAARTPMPSTHGGHPHLRARRRRWRSRTPSAPRLATDTRPVTSTTAAPAATPSRASMPEITPPTMTAPHALPDHVLVLCDGTAAGDGACRLAQRLSERRQAVVHAMAILPEDARVERTSLTEPGPIERFLAEVDAQLRRTTPTPAAWRLTLVVHDVEAELQRACAEFDADILLVPASLRAPESDVLRAASVAVASTARVFGRSAPIICVVAAEAEAAASPADMPQASLRMDAGALASARPGDASARANGR